MVYIRIRSNFSDGPVIVLRRPSLSTRVLIIRTLSTVVTDADVYLHTSPLSN